MNARQEQARIPKKGIATIKQHNVVVKPNGISLGRHPESDHQVRHNPATYKPGVNNGKQTR